ncbi:unnamed protein product, partial [Mesorhabditis belari]|uniref:Uncharacterized protein n=1 Tax=Mesorhabditis belari TaxID=2138241 RepID=A0AAF3FI46_9BILA
MVDEDAEVPFQEPSTSTVDRRRVAARCCFGRFSSKIGAYLFTSFFAHEIAIAMIYTLKRHHWSTISLDIPLLTIRCCQLITVAIAYFGLWKHKHYFLIPFIVSQLTLGAYSDLSTWMILVKEQSSKGKVPSVFFSTPLFYLVLPILLYASLCIFFTYVMYKCFAFFKIRYATMTRSNEFPELTEMESF